MWVLHDGVERSSEIFSVTEFVGRQPVASFPTGWEVLASAIDLEDWLILNQMQFYVANNSQNLNVPILAPVACFCALP